MTAAVYQGVMLNTMDTGIWVDLPTRQYMRLWSLIRSQGGTAMSQTVYVLEDGKMINFLFEITGLNSFAAEFRDALTLKMEGLKVKVLPLARILKSKKAIMRDKDLAHIPHIERALKAQKKLGRSI
jgi:predicted nucleotidyltransferase